MIVKFIYYYEFRLLWGVSHGLWYGAIRRGVKVDFWLEKRSGICDRNVGIICLLLYFSINFTFRIDKILGFWYHMREYDLKA